MFKAPAILRRLNLSLNTDILYYRKSKFIEIPTNHVYNTILDIPNYHKFVPWCTESHWIGQPIEDDYSKIHRNALLTVNFLFVKESYVSKVSYEPHRYIKAVASDSKLFEKLDTTWALQSENNGTLIDFSICYKFRNPLYQHLSNTFNDKIAKTMLSHFVDECNFRLNPYKRCHNI
ncbi:uncharacterized protein TOT_030000053 [Theileria orientalis strain Shintoku]|uniref:Coenzyme Q-binding protein COQ10 START domain-containing protein n=1 Tax=Theileria orientalis strain Shintoku TaxID=869250 RepID=J4C3P3_THEOR|nr:uncharacterized protein TOT_030000053 [Theileria orientalis strain Shintoku]PVC49971.1 hypothetical protein MACL_00002610 [Theileria orientalis]BAM40791.1 uncharacterized protein TOT_030000053 [Theileria orientalis strain Shintoku]|eukprot:XP_009691092.1 uncharacterized protein TOT_030000053 [Theileria orientalis strain Shintoku]